MDIAKPLSANEKIAAVVSKPGKPELASIVPELFAWFRHHQYEVVADRETATHAPEPKCSAAMKWPSGP